MSKTISQEVKNKIVNFYKKEPIAISKVAKEFSLCKVTISRILNEARCKIYTKQDLCQKDLIVDYFKTIDTEEKAYFLGLIFSDGCIFTNKYKNSSRLMSIQLQKEDGYMINLIKEKIKAPRKVIEDRRDGSKSITVTNSEFCNHIIAKGVVEHKKCRQFAVMESPLLMRHFIRGIFDGDGSVYQHTVTGKWNIVLLGDNYLLDICKYIYSCIDIAHNTLSYVDSIYMIKWAAMKDVKKLIDFLYPENTNFFLYRKLTKCLNAVRDIDCYLSDANTEVSDKLTDIATVERSA